MTVEEWLGKDNEIGIDIWNRKYRHGNESFDNWLDRVSGEDQELRQLIKDKKFLFGGRILSNRGLNKEGYKITYSNCYVVTPPDDNIESIFECASKLARTYSYGGGCGTDLSKLAPKGAKVNNTAESTSGAVSFMDLYSMVTGLIGQNGRRGALMLSLDCTHPDLEEFIDIKSDLNKVTKANISVKITDEFMQAVVDDNDFELSFKREETGEEVRKTVSAKKIFMKLAEQNWNMAEPGILNWSRIKKWNMLSNNPEFEYAGTNPCAEEPLPAGGSCLLGSLNLSEFVKNPFTDKAAFDINEFIRCVEIAVRAMNDILDEGIPLHPLKEQQDSVRDWRQIGLGVMGISDMLLKLGLKYGDEKSISECSKIAEFLLRIAIVESSQLAKEKKPYPKCNKKLLYYNDFIAKNVSEQERGYVYKYGLRNSQLLTIAPTGTISTMIGVSGGIEPIFAKSYNRKTESLCGEDKVYKIYTPIVKEYMEFTGIKNEDELPEYFVTANDIPYKQRLEMQAAWQKYIDASISSTVNLPKNTTKEEIFDLYVLAWKLGLKGATIFRDGCDRAGILTTSDGDQESQQLKRGDIIQVNDDVIGKKRKLTTGCGSLHFSAWFDPETGDLVETYLDKGSKGGCNSFMVGLSRFISTSARSGVGVETIIDQLYSCPPCTSYTNRTAMKRDTSKGSCCPVAIGNALKEMFEEVQYELGNIEDEQCTADKKQRIKLPCPECGEELYFEGGCNVCKSCGYSKCD